MAAMHRDLEHGQLAQWMAQVPNSTRISTLRLIISIKGPASEARNEWRFRARIHNGVFPWCTDVNLGNSHEFYAEILTQILVCNANIDLNFVHCFSRCGSELSLVAKNSASSLGMLLPPKRLIILMSYLTIFYSEA